MIKLCLLTVYTLACLGVGLEVPDSSEEEWEAWQREVEKDQIWEDVSDKVNVHDFEHGSSFEDNLGESLKHTIEKEFLVDVPVAEYVETIQQVADFMDDQGGVLGLFKQGGADADSPLKTFFNLSEHFSKVGVPFAYSQSKELLDHFQVNGKYKLIVYQQPFMVDMSKDKYESIYPKAKVLDFIKAERFIRSRFLPVVGEITYENEDFYDQYDAKMIVFVTAPLDRLKKADEMRFYADKLRKISSQVGQAIGDESANQIVYGLVNSTVDASTLRFFSAELVLTKSQRSKLGGWLCVRKGRNKYYRDKSLLSDPMAATKFILNVWNNHHVEPLKLQGQYVQAAKGLDYDKQHDEL
mmetsp:Transcript_44224/g.70684  ORF Transcript_44224/g.70684 Transcript_44224/m.70684 type:complete len:354 (-) Transcript_44224:1237-2298(-)